MSQQRTVKVYSTKGGNKTITTSAKTWGELKPLVEDAGYDLSNLQPTESVNKATLQHRDAVLPSQDFILYLRPIRTKAGNDDFDSKGFKELRALVTEEAKSFLNNYKTGKNWTQLSTKDLREGLKEFYSPKKEKEEAVNESIEELNPIGKVGLAIDLISQAVEEFGDEDASERVSVIVDDLQGLLADMGEEVSDDSQVVEEMEEGFDEDFDDEDEDIIEDMEDGFDF